MLLIKTWVKARPQSNAAPRLGLVARQSSDRRNSCWIQSGFLEKSAETKMMSSPRMSSSGVAPQKGGPGVGQGVGVGWHSGILTW